MSFHRKDGKGGIFDDGGNEAPSFRLKKVTDLKKMVKKDFDFDLQLVEEPDIDMTEVIPKKERETEYSMYTDEGRQTYFYLKQKDTKLKESAAAANVNHHTARKWKQREEGLRWICTL